MSDYVSIPRTQYETILRENKLLECIQTAMEATTKLMRAVNRHGQSESATRGCAMDLVHAGNGIKALLDEWNGAKR